MRKPASDFIPTSSIVAGDTVRWTESVFEGQYPNSRFVGKRTITATIKNESYGADKQQHTFTLICVSAEGSEAPRPGDKLRRKGRNLYRFGVERLKWDDEAARKMVADEKHARGKEARAARDRRKQEAGQ